VIWLRLLVLELNVVDAVVATAEVWVPVLLVLVVAFVVARWSTRRRRRADMSGPVRTSRGQAADVGGEGAVTSKDKCPDVSGPPDARS
jgi:hypothetical protein